MKVLFQKRSFFLLFVLFATAFSLSAFLPGPVQAPQVWKVDKAHSSVKFTITHLLISEVDGFFAQFDGEMTHTKEDFSDAKINFTVEVASVNTNSNGRDNHLKKPDFFDAEKFPQMKFVSTSFKKTEGKNYRLTGDLTIRDVTKSVVFDVVYNGKIDTQRGAKAGFKAKTTIKRKEFGVSGGGAAVGDEAEVVLNLEMNQQKAS